MSPRVAGRLAALAMTLLGVGAPAEPPPAPLPPIGFMRLRPGLTFTPQGSAALMTQEVEIEHGGNPAFHRFLLDVTEVDAHSLRGFAFDLILEEGGALGFGLSAELAWLDSGPVRARISSARDPISEQVPGLVEGVSGAITGYLRCALSIDMSYRVQLDGWALFAQGGLGLGLSSVELAFALGSQRNLLSATATELLIPVQLGADVALSEALFVSFGYTLYALPLASQRFSAGLGLHF